MFSCLWLDGIIRPPPHFQPSVGFSQNVFVSHYRENQEFHNHNLSSSLEVDVRLAVNQWSLSLISWSSLKQLQSVTNAADTFPVAPIISQPNRWKSTCLCQLSLVEFSSYLYIPLMFVFFIYLFYHKQNDASGMASREKMQKRVFFNYLAFLKPRHKKLISLGCLTLTVQFDIRPLFTPSSGNEGKFLRARLTQYNTRIFATSLLTWRPTAACARVMWKLEKPPTLKQWGQTL